MTPEIHRDLIEALERPHRLGTIGGDLEEQLAHCASFSSVLGQVVGTRGDRSVAHERRFVRGVDLGTGGGLPGLALAQLHPEMNWTLVDMRTARADEVERIVLRLGLSSRVEVRGIEAQRLAHEPAHRGRYDVVVARAFGAPSLVAECAAGLLRTGGVLLVSEPPADASGTAGDGAGPSPLDRWPRDGLRQLGFGEVAWYEHDQHRFAVVDKVAETGPSIPRLPARANRGWPPSTAVGCS